MCVIEMIKYVFFFVSRLRIQLGVNMFVRVDCVYKKDGDDLKFFEG